MQTLQERLDNPKIFPKLKKAFEETWGTNISFQYIDDELLDFKAEMYNEKTKTYREMTDKEVIQYFKENLLDIFDDCESPSTYHCNNCLIKYASDTYVLDRYPDLISEEFDLMNWCEDCQDDYIQK